MLKIYKHTGSWIGMIALLALAVSCKKSFLEVKPKGKVIASKTSDYDLLLNNLDLINIGADGSIPMGDELVSIEPIWTGASFRDKQLFQWKSDVYGADEDAKETLAPVKGLYVYNKIIAEVMDATNGTEAAKKSLQAEAYAGRAWTNFLLINYYGKPYDPATAATDPGFPIITKADINTKNFTRASVQAVYEHIVSDLQTAIPNLSSVGPWHRIRMSKAAAKGVLAKVYVFMGRYPDALPVLNEALDDIDASTTTTKLVDFNTEFQGFPTVVNDYENVYAKTVFNSYTGTSNRVLWLKPEVAALYDSTDLRLQKWYITNTYPNGLTLYKRANTFTTSIGVRVGELYLLRAEVKARLDDLQGAVADLEFFRKHRMPADKAMVPTNIATSKIPLLQFIMDERIREFATQGYRWFDMRRLSVDPLFGNKNFQHYVYSEAGEISQTINFDNPEDFVFDIPPKILAENPNF